MQKHHPQPKGITMSNEKTVTAVPDTTADATETETIKKSNVLVRSFRKIKENPSTTLAVVAGAALVAGSAFLGRKTAPMHIEIVESDVEPEPVLQTSTSDDSVAS